jgi:hypothetical protein
MKHARHDGPSLEGEPWIACSPPIEKLSRYALLFAYVTETAQTLTKYSAHSCLSMHHCFHCKLAAGEPRRDEPAPPPEQVRPLLGVRGGNGAAAGPSLACDAWPSLEARREYGAWLRFIEWHVIFFCSCCATINALVMLGVLVIHLQWKMCTHL